MDVGILGPQQCLNSVVFMLGMGGLMALIVGLAVGYAILRRLRRLVK